VKKFLQHSFLWLAVLTLIGHAIIPHHHHLTGIYSCAIDKAEHPSINSNIHGECGYCDDGYPHEHCHFTDNSIYKHTAPLQAITVLADESVFYPPYFLIKKDKNDDHSNPIKPFFNSFLLRGPPVVCYLIQR